MRNEGEKYLNKVKVTANEKDSSGLMCELLYSSGRPGRRGLTLGTEKFPQR